MTKINQSIIIVSSSIKQLSSMSQPSRQAIKTLLEQHYQDVSIQLVDTLADLKQLVAQQPDLVFLGMKFIPSNSELGINDPNKIWLSDYLTDHGIVTTGSPSQAHQLELNKHLAKQQVARDGLPTARFFTISQHNLDITAAEQLNYPLFVKPTNRGGGLGIDSQSVVSSDQQLVAKVKQIADLHQSDALVEELLPGREFSVAILRQPHNMQYRAMPIELVVEADESGLAMLSQVNKQNNGETVLTVDDEPLKHALSKLAIDAFKSIGGRDYGRIDIRLDANGRPNFLEANLIPSLIDQYGSFPKSCALNQSLSYEKMILTIVELASLRQTSHLSRQLGIEVPSSGTLSTI